MKSREKITTEDLRVKFTNKFALVNYAIKLAENMILSGRECRVHVDSESRAMQILEEIAEGKDQLDEIPAPSEPEERRESHHHHRELHPQETMSKMLSKKGKKVLL